QDMRKEELVSALRRVKTAKAKVKIRKVKKKPARPAKARPVRRTRPQLAAARNTNGTRASAGEQAERSNCGVGRPTNDLPANVPKALRAGYGRDRIVVMVRDPYWLHCYWELTRHAIARAEAALGQEWHTARPILRVLDVSSRDITNTAESIVRDIDIHGGC